VTFSVSKERFFTVRDLWIATMEGHPLPTRTYSLSQADIRAHAGVRGLAQARQGAHKMPREVFEGPEEVCDRRSSCVCSHVSSS
jgi:hypothetical protein